ncbi:MAG: ankyrin repeat domain-containing protein, partial [Rhodospirillales bacterium]|nr:ankyrin repeat domain-containing protein [Rhodospirillales bacterium]
MIPVCSIEIERLGAPECNRIAVPIKRDPLKAAALALPGADKTANMGMIRAGSPEPDPAPNPGGTKVRIAGRVITLTVTFRRLQNIFSGPRPMALAWMFAAAMLVAPAASAQAPSSDAASAVATKRLFQAVYDNDLRAVQSSVAIGADIAARDRHGLTPSDIAVDKGFFDIAHFLLSVRNLRLDQNAEPETAAARARRTKSGSV